MWEGLKFEFTHNPITGEPIVKKKTEPKTNELVEKVKSRLRDLWRDTLGDDMATRSYREGVAEGCTIALRIVEDFLKGEANKK